MRHSIQEFLKRINSKLTATDCLSLIVTTLCLLGFSGYLFYYEGVENIPVSYSKENVGNTAQMGDSRPFASTQGKTYTFLWCQNSGMIKNRVYFTNEEDAQKSGRTLSKLCQK